MRTQHGEPRAEQHRGHTGKIEVSAGRRRRRQALANCSNGVTFGGVYHARIEVAVRPTNTGDPCLQALIVLFQSPEDGLMMTHCRGLGREVIKGLFRRGMSQNATGIPKDGGSEHAH